MLSKITEQHILCQDRSKVSQTITQLSSQICATKSSVDQDRLEDQLRNKLYYWQELESERINIQFCYVWEDTFNTLPLIPTRVSSKPTKKWRVLI